MKRPLDLSRSNGLPFQKREKKAALFLFLSGQPLRTAGRDALKDNGKERFRIYTRGQ